MFRDACDELRRKFVRSFMDLIVIRLLADKPLWGYKLMTTIKDVYDIKVGPSVIYPLLDGLEEAGFIEGSEEYDGKRRRKIYRTTPEGLEQLECLGEILKEFSVSAP